MRHWQLQQSFAAALCVVAIVLPAQQTIAVQQAASNNPLAMKRTIIADPEMINLGFVEPRSTVTRSFRLLNTSSAAVTIKSATPSCTCTTIDAVGKVIPGQGSIDIPITMKIAASTGAKSASVTFTFSDGSAPVSLGMGGEVAYQVRATTVDPTVNARVPYINAFDDPARPAGTPAPSLAGTIAVVSIDQKPFRVLSVMNAPPVFVGFDPSKDTPRTSYEIAYDFSKVPCEKMPRYVVIETDHPQAPVVDLRVRHACTRIMPEIPFAEYRANLGSIAPGTTQPFEFELKKAAGWRVTQVTSKDPRLTAALVDQRADADHALVSLTLKVDAAVTGVVLAPISMVAIDPAGKEHSSDFWVYFTTRPQPVQ